MIDAGVPNRFGFSWRVAAFVMFAGCVQPADAAPPAPRHAPQDLEDHRSAEADSRLRQEEQHLRAGLDRQERLVGECMPLRYKTQSAPYRQSDMRDDSERRRIASQYAQCRQLNRAEAQQVVDLRVQQRRKLDKRRLDRKTLARRQEERRQEERRQQIRREDSRRQELRMQASRQQERRRSERQQEERRRAMQRQR